MSDTPELAPCPFCSSSATLENLAPPDQTRRMTVGCSNERCFAYLPDVWWGTEKEAIAAWNRRPSSEAGKGEALDRDELLGITEYLLEQADLDTPADDEPECDDLCGARVCHEVGCVVSKYRRVHNPVQPSGHKP